MSVLRNEEWCEKKKKKNDEKNDVEKDENETKLSRAKSQRRSHRWKDSWKAAIRIDVLHCTARDIIYRGTWYDGMRRASSELRMNCAVTMKMWMGGKCAFFSIRWQQAEISKSHRRQSVHAKSQTSYAMIAFQSVWMRARAAQAVLDDSIYIQLKIPNKGHTTPDICIRWCVCVCAPAGKDIFVISPCLLSLWRTCVWVWVSESVCTHCHEWILRPTQTQCILSSCYIIECRI